MTASVARLRPARDGRHADEAATLAHGASRRVVHLLMPMSLLLVVGLGALLSASSVVGLREAGDSLFYIKRQVLWMALGVIALFVGAATPVRWWRRLASPAFGLTVLALVAVLVVGHREFGATRWLVAGPLSVQPSEIAKLSTILMLATVMSRRELDMFRLRDFFIPVMASLGVVSVLVMLEPDLGTTLLIASGGLAVLFTSAAPMTHVLSTAMLGGAAAIAAARTSSYRWARITAFLDIGSDPLGDGYQGVQSLVALGTGGLFGVGLGASRARWSFLPNAHTDFIFSIVGEETGLAGSLAVVVLFVAFTLGGLAIARNAATRFGRMAAVGITTWLSMQALVNIGGAIGVLPITGVPLPFVSFGGTALVTEMAAVGLLVAVARDPRPQGQVAG